MSYRTVELLVDAPRKSAVGYGTIRPGNVIETYNAAGVLKVRNHSTAGGTAAPILALANEAYGKGVDTNYATSEQVQYRHFRPGDEVAVWLKDGEVATADSFLESAGDGSVRVVDEDASAGDIKVHSVLFKALESKSPSGADVQVKALVL